ncbi:MAG TPA: hypothetical protein VNJ07_06745 [Chitinophagales bacterium]|nr:hypothetical protein [Chitinophagales bacterium]
MNTISLNTKLYFHITLFISLLVSGGGVAFGQYNLQLTFEDKRSNPQVYGELFSRAIVVFGTNHTLKDKKGKLFPAFQKLFTERLAAKGYAADSNAICRLHVDVTNLYIKNTDQYFYMETEQRCGLTVKLIIDGSMREIFSREMYAQNNSRANELRQKNKETDYKLREPGSAFLIVIDSIINQLIPELESSKNRCVAHEIVTLTPATDVSTEQCQCDIIYAKDGSELKSKVEEITADAVKYKKIDQPEGPIRYLPIYEVFMIVYQDGTRKLFK